MSLHLSSLSFLRLHNEGNDASWQASLTDYRRYLAPDMPSTQALKGLLSLLCFLRWKQQPKPAYGPQQAAGYKPPPPLLQTPQGSERGGLRAASLYAPNEELLRGRVHSLAYSITMIFAASRYSSLAFSSFSVQGLKALCLPKAALFSSRHDPRPPASKSSLCPLKPHQRGPPQGPTPCLVCSAVPGYLTTYKTSST